MKQVNFADINLVGGGVRLETDTGTRWTRSAIVTVKAIAVSYETFEGDTWENDCF